MIKMLKEFFYEGDKMRYMRVLLTGSLIAAFAAYIYPYLLKMYTGAPAISAMGQYGDVYGGLNTLFTGLAFVGLIVTILQQRQEMKETREEFEEQTKQFEEQTRLLNEQIEEQKRANEKQFQLALASQYKEELFKRLDIITALEKDICLDKAYAVFHGEWTRDCEAVLKGDAAFELFFFHCTDFLFALHSKNQLSVVQKMQLLEQQRSMYVALNRLNSWLFNIYDYVHDVPLYFEKEPNSIGVFYRLLFNSLSKNAESILLMGAGQIIPESGLQVAQQKGYILATNVLPIHLDKKAKELLWKYVNMDVSVESARIEWQNYLRQSGVEYEATNYKPLRPLV